MARMPVPYCLAMFTTAAPEEAAAVDAVAVAEVEVDSADPLVVVAMAVVVADDDDEDEEPDSPEDAFRLPQTSEWHPAMANRSLG